MNPKWFPVLALLSGLGTWDRYDYVVKQVDRYRVVAVAASSCSSPGMLLYLPAWDF